MAEDGGLDGALGELWRTLGERADADPEESYTARLLGGGAARVAQKVGEEANETVIAAVSGDRGASIAESADLLYHLLVLWRAVGIGPEEVAAELRRRRRGGSARGEGGGAGA